MRWKRLWVGRKARGMCWFFCLGHRRFGAQRELAGIGQRHDLAVLPLYGSLPAEEQMTALQPSSRRKIILATNIAETSLTIEGVRWVIDAGLARVPMFDVRRGLDRLELKRISKASATQRAGARAGPRRENVCGSGRRRSRRGSRNLNCRRSSGWICAGRCWICMPGGNPIRGGLDGLKPPRRRRSNMRGVCWGCWGRWIRRA